MRLYGGTATQLPKRRFTAAPLNPFWFEYAKAETVLRSPSYTDGAPYTFRDAVVVDREYSGGVYDQRLCVTKYARSREETITFTSLDPSRATVDSTGWVTHVSDGPVTIRLSSPVRTVDVPLVMSSPPTSSTYKAFQSWVNGSLAKAITDRDVTLRAGKVPADRFQFTTLGSNGVGMVRNPNWLMLGLNGCYASSAWKSDNGYNIGVTMLTRRHGITCEHNYTHRYVRCRWVGPDGTVHERYVERTMRIAGTDALMLTFDSDLPEEIGFYKVIAEADIAKLAWFCAFLESSTPTGSGVLPVWSMDKEKKVHAYNLAAIHPQGSAAGSRAASFGGRFVDGGLDWREPLILGDSGHPTFAVLGNDMILLETHTGSSGGPYTPSLINEINAAITAMDLNYGQVTGYQCTPVDLSAYPSYG
jgi:hypothetical protein